MQIDFMTEIHTVIKHDPKAWKNQNSEGYISCYIHIITSWLIWITSSCNRVIQLLLDAWSRIFPFLLVLCNLMIAS